ncbi:thrombospondin-1-like [Haliotis cracherodii]|uniref:thrombospondin-1-like n=1 Tax=Haliotis cracherodii TaxID=6455 RepID=UPI0039E8CE05
MWIPQALATLWIILTVVSNASSQATANNSWGVWGNWTESCRSTCGSNVRGIQTRERSCTVGTSCSGEGVQTRTSQCVVPECPANNSWGVWGNWTESCRSTCGSNVRGLQTRERSCTVGTSCSGEGVQTRTSQCVVPECPEGNWRFWEEWTETCSATCGSGVTGMKSRTRTCNDPSGTDCPGPSNQTEVSRCSLQACTEGNWRFWEEWTETCSATCGSGVTGMKSRTRTCNNPSGTDCPGPSNQTEVSRCSLQACTVNGSGKMTFQTPLLVVVILSNLLAY